MVNGKDENGFPVPYGLCRRENEKRLKRHREWLDREFKEARERAKKLSKKWEMKG